MSATILVALLATPGLRATALQPTSLQQAARSASLRCCASDEKSALQKLFTTNRNSPEARANQLKWARREMDLEVPSVTLEGTSIQNRDDFVRQYIESEKAKFGREIGLAEAEAEVDAWLLKQATAAPAKTSVLDVASAVLVFVAAFGSGVYFNSPSGGT
jgi:hypothetical protein